VEAIAPHEAGTYIDDKLQMWLDAGVRLAWVVYPQGREVVVHRSGRHEVVLAVSDTRF
jgi:hypothetical protein